MNNFKMREAFLNQYGQCIIIDLNDIKIEYLQNIINALKQILAIGCSIRGNNRIPAFQLSILTGILTTPYELNIIRGNFNKIAYALNSLINYCQINDNVSVEDYNDILYLAVNSAIINFKTKIEKKEINLIIPKIEITIISMKDYKDIGNIIQLFLTNIDVTYVHKINVIKMQSSNESSISNFADQENIQADYFVKNHDINGEDCIQIKNYFKHWLTDKSTEIASILYFPSTSDINLKIKCDIRECIINPLSLPFGHRFYLPIESPKIQFTESTSSSNIPIFELNITSRINPSNVCKSTLYGLPFCLTPSKSWRLSYEEQKLNEEHFIELCRQLEEDDKYLLAHSVPYFLTDQLLPYFVLIPENGCLLVKSFASNDITMPWEEKNTKLPVASYESSVRIYKNLHNLEQIDNIKEKIYDSGLLSHLIANLEHAKCQNTYEENEQSCSKKRKRVLTKNFQ